MGTICLWSRGEVLLFQQREPGIATFFHSSNASPCPFPSRKNAVCSNSRFQTWTFFGLHLQSLFDNGMLRTNACEDLSESTTPGPNTIVETLVLRRWIKHHR
eukprot:scaffold4902_cov115-Cylindrotheca_fusiformis.AAC.1